ncbi:MAG: Ku protein [Chloroflexi bacterium]|nr:MAG: Ku protein [Actinobacteria bacterium 13_1_40CM_66_12]TMF44772.1 MAG: Ku protein [Chloroflexota bacterium]
MPRSMWKGVVSFGMVSIPIRLYNATESSAKVSFRQLCPDHHSPISYKRWCAEGEHEVQYGEILKGFEVGKDRYVIINDKDLDNIPLATAHSIDITEFVPSDDIEPGLYYNSAYYVEPEELGKKPYHLLRKALEATGRMAVAKIALRDREHLAALHPMNGALLMNTLHWPDEIRSIEGLKGLEGEVKINPKELEMAKALIESLADSFDASRYKDEYREAVMKVVQAKIDGEVIEAPAPPQTAKVMDLMEALRASVDAAKKSRAARDKAAPAEAKRARRKAS